MDAMRRSSGSAASTATASSGGGLSPATRYQRGALVGSGSFGEVYAG